MFVLLLLVCVCVLFVFALAAFFLLRVREGVFFVLSCCRGLLSKTKHPLTPTAKNKASPPAATIKKTPAELQ